jgi:Ca-activated chloride channel family protein
MPREENHYTLLGLNRYATQEEIRTAYFDSARRLHPDTNPDPAALEVFLQVQNAYSILSNPDSKSTYDANLPEDEAVTPAVSFTVQYSRNAMARMAESQLVYALVDLTSIPDPSATNTPPLNICIVIDRSTSMQGARMDMVKASTLQLIKQMRPQDTVSVVTYSDRAEVLIPASRISDMGRLQARVNMIQPSGGTEIFYGLEAGLNQLRSSLSPTYINHMILLTDGRTYGDEEACMQLAEEAAKSGIGISGLGIGSEWNDAFLDRLAGCGGGSSMYVTSPNDMTQFLEEKCKSLGKLYAEQVLFEFEMDSNVALRYAFRMLPEAGPLPIDSPIRVGNIGQFRSLRILFEFLVDKVPEESDNVVLAAGMIRMEIPTWTAPSTKLKLNLRLPVRSAPETDSPPNAILQAMSKLTLYRMQERARAEVDAGEAVKATRHLQYLASNLISQGQKDLAQAVLVEADSVNRSQKFSKDGDKRIKYGTRALLLPSGPDRDSL